MDMDWESLNRHGLPTRRALLSLALAAPLVARAKDSRIGMQVWKSARCDCCKDWLEHMEKNGFVVTRVHNEGNAAARERLKIPAALGACHTALVRGFVIEGHVPAADVHRVIKLRTDAVGLAVPGMPVGSPGMDGPLYGKVKEAYDVLLVGADGKTTVFSRYASSESDRK